jgi:hypothetical protein
VLVLALMILTLFTKRNNMALSNQTIHNLSVALTPEVIKYIYGDERWIDFMMEMIPEAVAHTIKSEDMDLVSELALCIFEDIHLAKYS